MTDKARRVQAALNEVYEGAEIILDAGDVVWSGPGRVLKIDNAYVIPSRKSCYRVFNRGSFRFGGRAYGGYWQNLSKARRLQLTINGSSVERHDHAELHPRLLYAERGLSIDGGSAYAVPGYDHSTEQRKLAKKAFNTAVMPIRHTAVWVIAGIAWLADH